MMMMMINKNVEEKGAEVKQNGKVGFQNMVSHQVRWKKSSQDSPCSSLKAVVLPRAALRFPMLNHLQRVKG